MPLLDSLRRPGQVSCLPESAANLLDIGRTRATLILLAAITTEQVNIIHRIWNMSTKQPKKWRSILPDDDCSSNPTHSADISTSTLGDACQISVAELMKVELVIGLAS